MIVGGGGKPVAVGGVDDEGVGGRDAVHGDGGGALESAVGVVGAVDDEPFEAGSVEDQLVAVDGVRGIAVCSGGVVEVEVVVRVEAAIAVVDGEAVVDRIGLAVLGESG